MSAAHAVGAGFDEVLAPGETVDQHVAEAAHAQTREGKETQRKLTHTVSSPRSLVHASRPSG